MVGIYPIHFHKEESVGLKNEQLHSMKAQEETVHRP